MYAIYSLCAKVRYFALVVYKRCIQKTGHHLSNFILRLWRMGDVVITPLNSSLRRLYSGRVLGEESPVFQDDDFHSGNVMRTVNEPSGPEVCSTFHSGLLHTSSPPPPLIILPSVFPSFHIPPSPFRIKSFLSSLFFFPLPLPLFLFHNLSPFFLHPLSLSPPLPQSLSFIPFYFNSPSSLPPPNILHPSPSSSLLSSYLVPSPSYQTPFSLPFPPLLPSSVLEF
jgi:hypothetical protein